MFHNGHLSLLKTQRKDATALVIGVFTDEVVQTNKHKTPIAPFSERVQTVAAIRYVGSAILQDDYRIDGRD